MSGADDGFQISPEDAAELVSFQISNIVANCAVLSIFVVVYYDYLLSLRQEVRSIWRTKRSGVTIVFFVNRYLLLIIALLLLIQTFLWQTQKEVELFIMSILLGIVRLTQGAFAALRIFAIWNRNTPLALVILVLYAVPFVLSIVWTVHTQVVVLDAFFPGCYQIMEGIFYTLAWISPIFTLSTDAFVLVLTWMKTASIRKDALRASINVPVSTLLLRDGTLHFAVQLALSVADFVFMIVPGARKFNYFQAFIVFCQSINISHFIMNLRHVFLHDDGDDLPGSSRVSSIRFAASIVGNVGAPLSFSEDDISEQIQHWRGVNISDDPLSVGLSRSEEHNSAWSNETADRPTESPDSTFEETALYLSADKEHLRHKRTPVAGSGDDEDQTHEEQALIHHQE